MSTSNFFDLPSAPSDPCTPSDMGPGTPNSGTTSISALSTTAIKDGYRGHTIRPHHHHHHQSSTSSNSSTNTLDAERADRISRLAGLERVATARQPSRATAGIHASGYLGPGTYNAGTNASNPMASPLVATSGTQPAGYFDQAGSFVFNIRERSTVGSASATGSASAGAHTTWAEAEADEGDKMSVSEDQDVEQDRDRDHEDNVSSAGLSDNASLVGFGETATSTMSGPISAAPTPAGRLGWGASRASAVSGRSDAPELMQGIEGARARNRAHASLTGKETTERIVRERKIEASDKESTMEE